MDCAICPHADKIAVLQRDNETLTKKLNNYIENNDENNRKITEKFHEMSLDVKDILNTTKITQNDINHFTSTIEKSIGTIEKRQDKTEERVQQIELAPGDTAKRFTFQAVIGSVMIVITIIINWIFNK